MNTKEKSRPRRQPGTGRAETAAFGGAAISCSHSTTGGTGRQLRVSDVLCRGKENAQTMRELRQVLNDDSRTIRLEIEYARRHGLPIVSDCQRGYWIAENEHEKARFVRSMMHRAAQIVATAKAVERGRPL